MKNQINEIVPLPLQIEAFLNEEGYTTADDTLFSCPVLPYATKIGIVYQKKVPQKKVFSIGIPRTKMRIRIPYTVYIDGPKYILGVLNIENPTQWELEGYGEEFFNLITHPLTMLMQMKFGVDLYAELKDDESELAESTSLFI
jgi:hypothetical protein